MPHAYAPTVTNPETLTSGLRALPASRAVTATVRWWCQEADPACGAFPSRRQMNPRILGAALSHVWLAQVSGEGRFPCSLAGEGVIGHAGQLLRGRDISSLAPDGACRAEMQRCLIRVAETPLAGYCLVRAEGNGETAATSAHLILPLSDDGRSVSHLLGLLEVAPGGRSLEGGRRCVAASAYYDPWSLGDFAT